jgi:hypothetical protein
MKILATVCSAAGHKNNYGPSYDTLFFTGHATLQYSTVNIYLRLIPFIARRKMGELFFGQISKGNNGQGGDSCRHERDKTREN